jgi:hypothetical protein
MSTPYSICLLASGFLTSSSWMSQMVTVQPISICLGCGCVYFGQPETSVPRETRGGRRREGSRSHAHCTQETIEILGKATHCPIRKAWNLGGVTYFDPLSCGAYHKCHLHTRGSLAQLRRRLGTSRLIDSPMWLGPSTEPSASRLWAAAVMI